MTTQNRANEILSQITAFSKTGYTKAEYLPELMKLQDEVVNLTFNGEHAEEAKLRLWDVGDYLKRLNIECNGVADQELDDFIQMSKKIGNEISAEISGNKGERIVFSALDNLYYMPIGTKLRLFYSESNQNKVYLEKIEIIENV